MIYFLIKILDDFDAEEPSIKKDRQTMRQNAHKKKEFYIKDRKK